MYPDIVKLQKEMMQEGIIPACAEKRASFNAVTNYTNILHKAYRDFPATAGVAGLHGDDH